MDRYSIDTIKSLLHRLDDAKREINGIRLKAEYPLTSKLERAYDNLESAESYLQDVISGE